MRPTKMRSMVDGASRKQTRLGMLSLVLGLMLGLLNPAAAFTAPPVLQSRAHPHAGGMRSAAETRRCQRVPLRRRQHAAQRAGVCMSLEQAVFALSTLVSTFGFSVWETRPFGFLSVDIHDVVVRNSTVPGAGMGLFAATPLPAGTVLGAYPGGLWSASTWLRLKGLRPRDVLLPPEQRRARQEERQARAREYVWKLESGLILDPTSTSGRLSDAVPWLGNDFFLTTSAPDDIALPLTPTAASPLLAACPPAETSLSTGAIYPIPTVLCRINEPARGGDVNVVAEEGEDRVLFVCERAIAEGEELLLDYGPYHDRSPSLSARPHARPHARMRTGVRALSCSRTLSRSYSLNM